MLLTVETMQIASLKLCFSSKLLFLILLLLFITETDQLLFTRAIFSSSWAHSWITSSSPLKNVHVALIQPIACE